MATNGGEKLWKWVMRACAVAGFIALLFYKGLDAPVAYYVLLTGLFFGPEMITSKIKLITREDE